MSKIASAAWEAIRAEDEIKAEAARKLDEEQRRRSMEARNDRIRPHMHLLGESVLPQIFPDTEWYVLDAYDTHTGKPSLLVKEKGADSPSFRVTANGTFIDYEDVTYQFDGSPYRRNVSIEIKSVLDVGRYLKRKSEMLDASWRRYPD